MLANGPACTNAGVPSSVCIRLGLMASFISTVSAPAQPRSSAVTGSPCLFERHHHAAQPLAHVVEAGRQRQDRHDLAGDRDVKAGLAASRPFSCGPSPIVISRSMRSLMSTTRRQVIVAGSMSSRTKRLISSGVRSSGIGLGDAQLLEAAQHGAGELALGPCARARGACRAWRRPCRLRGTCGRRSRPPAGCWRP